MASKIAYNRASSTAVSPLFLFVEDPSGFSINKIVPTPFKSSEVSLISAISTELSNIKSRIDKLEKRESLCPTKIYDLNSDEYILKKPVDVILKMADDEIIALVPDLEIYGEGLNEFEALLDLKNELIDLFIDLNNIADEYLDKYPKSWKKIINSLVKEQ